MLPKCPKCNITLFPYSEKIVADNVLHDKVGPQARIVYCKECGHVLAVLPPK